jgi:hypothetical protein
VDDNSKLNMMVYENAQGQLVIRINKEGLYTVSIIDMSGTILMDKSIYFEANSDQTIPIGDIPDEVFLVKLQNTTNVIVKKVLTPNWSDGY